jgi:cytochrome d ubiquinol oxidase subunit II
MLGLYVMGLQFGWAALGFGVLTALCLAAAYAFIGATWLILKTEGPLQQKAVGWAQKGLWGVALGFGSISLASPFVSPRIFDKWFSVPEIVLLAPLPILSGVLLVGLWMILRRLPDKSDALCWLPFAGAVGLFGLAFAGLAYSFYPYVVPDRMTIYEAAAAPESLAIMLVGVVFVLPAILGYTALAYYIFRGKARSLSYE